MARRLNHEALVQRGLTLHERRSYAAALLWFERALAIAPGCAVAQYNMANTLHMLGRDRDAEPILRRLIAVTSAELRRWCATADDLRSLQLDARYLLFSVLLYGRGFSAEAFKLAEEHLRLRRRGLRSLWPVREVRAEIAARRREWATPSGQAISARRGSRNSSAGPRPFGR
jgi:tetratricopeptide (TPR) repeat protein